MKRLLDWFNTKMKPYTQHLFTTIIDALSQESRNPNDREKFDEYAIKVRNDMELIHNSLKVFEKQMGFRLFTAGGDSVTIFDIMLYNEIS